MQKYVSEMKRQAQILEEAKQRRNERTTDELVMGDDDAPSTFNLPASVRGSRTKSILKSNEMCKEDKKNVSFHKKVSVYNFATSPVSPAENVAVSDENTSVKVFMLIQIKCCP